MALELKSAKVLIGSDCVTIEVQDSTGDYDVTTNPTGYGTPNPARNTFGVKLFTIEKSSAGDVVIDNVIQTGTSPTDASSWRFTNNIGGRYEWYQAAITNYAGGTTYAEDELAYDPTTKKFYRSKSAGNVGNAVTNTTYWEDVSALTEVEQLAIFRAASELADANDLMYFTSTDDLITCNLDILINNKIEEDNCDNCNEDCPESMKYVIKGSGIRILAAKGDYDNAQKRYEQLYNQLS